MSRTEEVLKHGSFGKLLLNLSLPSVLIIIIMLIYNIADTYFIGQTGNPKMISAISLSMPVFTILSGIGTLFGNGGTTSISIALGEGNREKVQKITTFCFFWLCYSRMPFFPDDLCVYAAAGAFVGCRRDNTFLYDHILENIFFCLPACFVFHRLWKSPAR